MNLFVISTLSCILEYIVPTLIKYAIYRLYAINKNDTQLRNDIINLKLEMTGISMVDEFSKYVKLQRKCNKLENALMEKAHERMSAKMKIQVSLTYVFRILNGLLMMVLLYLYSSTSVITLPKGILWPIQSLLSWPCYEEDSISLIMWVIIARTVVSTCKKIDVT